MTKIKYDVAIIGTGIGGSLLGSILVKHGLKVILFESGAHPKFSIGESQIIETSEILRGLAEVFAMPEIENYSSEKFFPIIGFSHGVKRHFSYLYHRENKDQDPHEVLQAVIPKEPYGHELHVYRQDSDSSYLFLAIQLGAKILQNTAIHDVAFSTDGVTVVTKNAGSYYADYVVDAGGYRSVLATKLLLRDFSLKTHSRSIFTHMVNLPSYHSTGLPRKAFRIPFSLAEGTLHHLFKGGWMWIIPFNNHPASTNPLCSVGLMLDTRLYPRNSKVSAEEEFYAFIKKYPGVEKQIRSARSVRKKITKHRLHPKPRLAGAKYPSLGRSLT